MAWLIAFLVLDGLGAAFLLGRQVENRRYRSRIQHLLDREQAGTLPTLPWEP